jgi:predicted transcriptional regulator
MLIQSTKELNDIKDKVSKCKHTIGTEIKYLKELLNKMGAQYNPGPLENELNKLVATISTSVEKQINENAKKMSAATAKELKKK